MPRLLALSVGPDIPLDRGAVMVGRHPECDVRLDSRRVSRRHCLIIKERGDLVVRDLGSTNGTWINGRRIAAAWIRPGDEVAIADIRFRMGGDTSPGVAAAEVPPHPDEVPYRSKYPDIHE